MIVCKLVKYLVGVFLASLFAALGWLWAAPPQANTWGARLLAWLKLNPVAGAIGIVACLVLCGLIWLKADILEKIRSLPSAIRLMPSKNLKPSDLYLERYSSFYLSPLGFDAALQHLREGRNLLVLGRVAAGKTRLVFELTRRFENHWILKVPPEFDDWDKIQIPHFPVLFRLKLIWIVDNLNEYRVPADPYALLDSLGKQCDIRMVATCRKGEEFAQATVRPQLRVWLEHFERTECSDLTTEETVLLARQTGQPQDPTLYDGTPGSVVLGLDGMRKRLETAPRECQDIMRALYLLREAYIFAPADSLLLRVLREVYHITVTIAKFETDCNWLIENHFLLRLSPELRATHDVYLTTLFFRFYGDREALERDLQALGIIIEAEKNPSRLLSLGTCWMGRENYERASHYLGMSIEFFSQDPVIWTSLGYSLAQVGRHAAAEQAFRRALGIAPAYDDALLNLSATLLDQDKLDESIQVSQSVLDRRQDSSAWNNLGLALVKKGELNEAAECYWRALGVRPYDSVVLNNLGIVLTKLKELDKAVKILEQALEINPEFPDALNNLGIALAEKGQVNDAIAALQRSLALKPQHLDSVTSLGMILVRADRWAEAGELYARALKLIPDNTQLLNRLAEVHARLGGLDDAIVGFRRSLELQPKQPTVLNELGLSLYQRGRLEGVAHMRRAMYKDAIAVFSELLALEPKNITALRHLGLLLLDGGQLAEATDVCYRALAISPEDPDVLYILATCLYRSIRWNEAIPLFRRAILVKPDFPEALHNLGLALRDAGQLDDAIATIERSISLKEDNSLAWNSLGTALAEKGQVEASIPAYRRALALEPSYAETHYNLAKSLFEAGRKEEARMELEEAFRLNPRLRSGRD